MAASGSRSKKRFAASFTSKPPSLPVFFLDRSIGKFIVAAALRAAGLEVRTHDECFPPDARDQDWLREVGRRGWAVLTRDRKIRHRKLELRALLRAQIPAFVFTGGNVGGKDMAHILVQALPKIGRFLDEHTPPFVAHITKTGSVEMLFSQDD